MMKKAIAFLLTAFMLFAVVSCGPESDHTTSTEQTAITEATTTTSEQGTATIDDTTLVSGAGLADSDGVYRVPDGITFIMEYAFANDTALKKVIIPDSVTEIGSGAFYGCSALKEVVMGNNVTSLGSLAFYGCLSLTDVTLSNTLDELLPYTFYYCRSLEEITLPDSITSVGSYCFCACSSLTSVNFGKGLTSIGTYAFSSCASLRKLNGIENTQLIAIGDNAFQRCVALKSVTLPETLTVIGLGSFVYCSNLTSVNIPSGVSYIGMMAFTGTPWYTENTDKFFIVGDGVLIKSTFNPNSADVPGTLDLSGLGIKSIGHSCFSNMAASGISSTYGYQYCYNIKDVIIPEGVIDIGSAAFYECTNIKSISLPSTLVSIGSSAFGSGMNGSYMNATVSFENCTELTDIGAEAFYNELGLEDIVLPDSVKQIGANAFTGTAAHYNFMDESLAAGDESNKFKIVGDGILLWAYVAQGQTSLVIPDGVKYIASNACAGWDNAVVYTDFEATAETELIKVKHRLTYNIESITIPEGVTNIGENAFIRMTNIDAIVLPDSLETIGASAFCMCGDVTSVTFGKNLTSIGANAFGYALFDKIELPSGLKSIGAGAFSNCSRLVSLVLPKGIESVGTSVVNSECTSLETVYMPRQFRSLITLIVDVQRDDVTVNYYIEK